MLSIARILFPYTFVPFKDKGRNLKTWMDARIPACQRREAIDQGFDLVVVCVVLSHNAES
jgi:hypothetical protein